MDSLKPWYGALFSLDQVYNLLKSLTDEQRTRKAYHELYMTWALAKCMTARNKKEYLIGFPFEKEFPDQQLSELIESKNALDEDFDKVIVDTKKLQKPMRLQIKRYINKEGGNTVDFFNYFNKKIRQYGIDETLNIIFDIQTAFELDVFDLGRLLKQHEFKVGSIFVYFLRGTKPNIMELHPKFTGAYFSPV